MKLTIPQATRPKMQDYGIETSDDGLLTWEWVRERLEQSTNYWVSTVQKNGNPHAAPVWGILLEDTVYFGTGEGSVKARNLQRNPNVVLHTESGMECVIVEGRVEKVTEIATFEQVAPVYAAKYKPHGYEPTAEELAAGLMYVVKPQVVMAWYEKKFPETATRWAF